MTKNDRVIDMIKNNSILDELFLICNIFLDIRYFTKKEISNFSNIELKYNCQKYGLNTIGTKSKLISRLNGIINPDEMPDDGVLKKRGKKIESDTDIQKPTEIISTNFNKDICKKNKKEILACLVNNDVEMDLVLNMVKPYINIFLELKYFSGDDIALFTKKDLEYNCQKYSLKSNGSKDILVKRLHLHLGLISQDEINEQESYLQKRGRKNQKTNEDNLDLLIQEECNNLRKQIPILQDINQLTKIYCNINNRINKIKTDLFCNELYIDQSNLNIYKYDNNNYLLIGKLYNNYIIY